MLFRFTAESKAFFYATLCGVVFLSTHCARKPLTGGVTAPSVVPNDGSITPGSGGNGFVGLEFYGPDTIPRGVCRGGFGIVVSAGQSGSPSSVEVILPAESSLGVFKDVACSVPLGVVSSSEFGRGIPLFLKGNRASTVQLAIRGTNTTGLQKAVRVGLDSRLELDGGATYSFGDVGLAATVNHTFMLTARGGESAEFRSATIVAPEMGFRVVSNNCAVLDTGDTCNIVTSFTPTAEAVSIAKLRVVYKIVNDELVVEKELRGRGIPGTNLNYLFGSSRSNLYTFLTQAITFTADGFAELALLDQTDEDSTSTGFGGGTSLGLTASAPIQIDSSVSGTPRSGRLVSRLLTTESQSTWNRLSWRPRAPYGKPLPDLLGRESGYSSGAMDMAGLNNILLLHLDEADGNSRDSSGVQLGGSTLSSGGLADPNGKLKGARAFNRTTSNYVRIAQLLSMRSDALTVAMWVKIPPISSGDHFIFSYAASGSTNELMVRHRSSDLGYYFSGSGPYVVTGVEIDDGNWHHVAFASRTVGTDSEIDFYIDGVHRYRKSNLASPTLKTGGTLVLGQEQDSVGGGFSTSQAFMGSIDEFAIFANVLNMAQIQDIYRRGAMRMNFQVRACPDLGTCNSVPFIGPSGTSLSFYNELTSPSLLRPSLPLAAPLSGKGFQYSVVLESDVATDSPALESVMVEPNHFVDTRPTLKPAAGVPFVALNGFSDSFGPLHQGTVLYRLSKDGTNWFYHDGALWKPSTSTLQANTVVAINANIATFIAAVGGPPISFFFEAVLVSPNGGSRVQLERVTVNGTSGM